MGIFPVGAFGQTPLPSICMRLVAPKVLDTKRPWVISPVGAFGQTPLPSICMRLAPPKVLDAKRPYRASMCD